MLYPGTGCPFTEAGGDATLFVIMCRRYKRRSDKQKVAERYHPNAHDEHILRFLGERIGDDALIWVSLMIARLTGIFED
jgi:hypothetical protein